MTLVQGRAGIGDDDDALHGIDAGVAKCLFVDASMAVGLERAAALARDNQHGVLEPIGDGRGDLPGVGGVENGEPDAGGGRNHFGRQRRTAHAGQDHVVDAGRQQLGMQVTEFGEVLPRTAWQVEPAKPRRCERCGVGAPEVRVFVHEALGHAGVNQRGRRVAGCHDQVGAVDRHGHPAGLGRERGFLHAAQLPAFSSSFF